LFVVRRESRECATTAAAQCACDDARATTRVRAQVIAHRKAGALWAQPQVQRYADDTFYAFTRGTTFVATTNVGSNGPTVTRTITYHPYADGTKLCNLCVPPQVHLIKYRTGGAREPPPPCCCHGAFWHAHTCLVASCACVSSSGFVVPCE
jgi:hypothetical protein